MKTLYLVKIKILLNKSKNTQQQNKLTDNFKIKII